MTLEKAVKKHAKRLMKAHRCIHTVGRGRRCIRLYIFKRTTVPEIMEIPFRLEGYSTNLIWCSRVEARKLEGKISPRDAIIKHKKILFRPSCVVQVQPGGTNRICVYVSKFPSKYQRAKIPTTLEGYPVEIIKLSEDTNLSSSTNT